MFFPSLLQSNLCLLAEGGHRRRLMTKQRGPKVPLSRSAIVTYFYIWRLGGRQIDATRKSPYHNNNIAGCVLSNRYSGQSTNRNVDRYHNTNKQLTPSECDLCTSEANVCVRASLCVCVCVCVCVYNSM